MKKKIAILVSLLIGLFAIAAGVSWRARQQAAIAVIGGSDGPTSIFIAGKLAKPSIYGYFLAGIIFIIVILLIVKNRNHKS